MVRTAVYGRSRRSPRIDRSWASDAGPMLPRSAWRILSVLTTVQRWHCAADARSSPGSETRTSEGGASLVGTLVVLVILGGLAVLVVTAWPTDPSGTSATLRGA